MSSFGDVTICLINKHELIRTWAFERTTSCSHVSSAASQSLSDRATSSNYTTVCRTAVHFACDASQVAIGGTKAETRECVTVNRLIVQQRICTGRRWNHWRTFSPFPSMTREVFYIRSVTVPTARIGMYETYPGVTLLKA